MTYWNMVSAAFLGNVLSWLAIIVICIPIAIIEYKNDKNNKDDE